MGTITTERGIAMKTLFPFLLFLAAPVWAMPADGSAPDWYYPQWLAEARHAPVFKVRDTSNKTSAATRKTGHTWMCLSAAACRPARWKSAKSRDTSPACRPERPAQFGYKP
jgi:hypothetical protein